MTFDQLSCPPLSGTLGQCCHFSRPHHLDITACSFCQWGLGSLAPPGFPHLHHYGFRGPPRIDPGPGFLAAGDCQLGWGSSLPCLTPEVGSSVLESLCRRVPPGAPANKEAALFLSSCPLSRLGPPFPERCLPFGRVILLLLC